MAPQIKCPKCESTQITANKKGFSTTQAIGCAILTGGIGLVAGTIGSGKIKITCLACGHQFKPGEDFARARKRRREEEAALQSPGFWIFLFVLIILIVIFVKACF